MSAPVNDSQITKSSWYLIGVILLLAAAVRLAVASVAGDIVDVRNYHVVAETVLQKGVWSLYAGTPGIYPYPPLWVWLEILAYRVEAAGLLSYSAAIRVPIILADTSIVFLIWGYLRGSRGDEAALRAALFYALNPVAIIISSMHAQFDALPVLFSLLSLYWLEQRRRVMWSAFALAIAVALKSYPLLLVAPIVLQMEGRRRRVFFTLATLLPVALLIAPFWLINADAVLREIASYRGAALLGLMVPIRSVYVPLAGTSFPAGATATIVSISAYVFLGAYCGLVVFMRRRSLPLSTQLVAIYLLFYIVYAGIAPQYLLWALPFLVLASSAAWPIWLYSAAGSGGLLAFYQYAAGELFPFSLPSSVLLSQVLYAVFGTLWWVAAIVLFYYLASKTTTVTHRMRSTV